MRVLLELEQEQEPGQRVGRWLGRPVPGQPEVVLLGLGAQGDRSGLTSGKSTHGPPEGRRRVNASQAVAHTAHLCKVEGKSTTTMY